MDPQQFLDLKMWLLDWSDLSRDALHVHVGIAVFLGLWLIFRRRWAGLVAWFIILGIAVYGEYLDHVNEMPRDTEHNEPEHRRDVINTMIWPTLLLILGWFVLRPRNTRADADISGDLPDQPVDEPRENPPTI